ncbi:MAG: ABC transporter ATP-binding protein [bacterium]|nr:ABC transporter ATP-binding protein [bacterium]
MSYPIETHALTKRFGSTAALTGIDWRLTAGTAVGLVGRNGSGKTTLLRTAAGLLVPSGGTCVTLGKPAEKLGEEELGRIGYVDQDAGLLEWLTVEQHIRYVAAFHPRWDEALERTLRGDLELDAKQRVGTLSKGTRQRLAVLLAVCHRPELLLLDEPVTALDPIVRESVLRMLVERVIEDGATIVISSHVLHDIEKVVDHVLCLEAGRVAADSSIDELKETFAEWIVTSSGAELPATFAESFVLSREGNGRHARLAVRAGEQDLARFREHYGVEVERRSLDLERIFPLLTEGGRS